MTITLNRLFRSANAVPSIIRSLTAIAPLAIVVAMPLGAAVADHPPSVPTSDRSTNRLAPDTAHNDERTETGDTTSVAVPQQTLASDTPGLAVLETEFGTGVLIPFTPHFQLDYSLRPSGEATKQFFINSGLDAEMSNGQMISDVATDAPSGWNPPHYNPLTFHSPNFGGNFTFGPATGPMDIDVEALTAAVMANAAKLETIRFELIKRQGDEMTVVASGEKEHFEFEASDGGVAGLSFLLQWKGISYNADEWYESDAQYAMRLTVGTEPDSSADLNGDGVVDSLDLFILLAAWGECFDPSDCPADLDDNGIVDVEDLFILLDHWG